MVLVDAPSAATSSATPAPPPPPPSTSFLTAVDETAPPLPRNLDGSPRRQTLPQLKLHDARAANPLNMAIENNPLVTGNVMHVEDKHYVTNESLLRDKYEGVNTDEQQLIELDLPDLMHAKTAFEAVAAQRYRERAGAAIATEDLDHAPPWANAGANDWLKMTVRARNRQKRDK